MPKIPTDPDPEVMRVEAVIRALTPAQWVRVKERLDLCPECGSIGAGGWCCYDSREHD